jgi:hypothetical protein
MSSAYLRLRSLLAGKLTPCYASLRTSTLARMKPSLDRPCFSRRTQRVALWLAICLPLYVLSTGPVAWATNDAFHPAYLPDDVFVIYLPLAPLAKIERVSKLSVPDSTAWGSGHH